MRPRPFNFFILRYLRYGNRVTIFRIYNSQTEKFDYLCRYGTALSVADMLRDGADDKTNMKHDGESAPLMARALFFIDGI